MANRVPLEHDEQVAFVNILRTHKIKHFAVPNGANKSKAAQRRFKAEGLEPGVPDLMIPYPRLQFAGLFIEMKRKSGGTIGPHQIEWIEFLRSNGYCVFVCRGWEEAWEVTKAYLSAETRVDFEEKYPYSRDHYYIRKRRAKNEQKT